MNLRNELEEGPLLHISEMYLGGIFVEDEQIILDEHIVLIKPTPTDIEKQLGRTFGGFNYLHHIPTAIATISKKSKEQNEIIQEQEKLLSILRLFHLGSVYADSYRMSNTSVIWPVYG